MRIINGYLSRTVIGVTALVMLVFLALAGFIEFISQLDDLGDGDYGLAKVLAYVLLKLPRTAFGVLPVSVLLGTLLGLGGMAVHSELIVLRSSGVALWQLARSLAVVGVLVALFAAIIGEYIAPPLDRYARQMKAAAKNSDVSLSTGKSAWLRDGNMVFNVNRTGGGLLTGGVYIYEVDEQGRLQSIGHAESAELSETRGWVLKSYAETALDGNSVVVREVEELETADSLRPDILALTEVRSSSLDGYELYQYIQYLRANGLDPGSYEVALWSRIASLAGIVFMCMLALPFSLGSLRSSGAGTRMLVGVIVGLAYFLLGRMLNVSDQVYDLNPVLVAWIPTLCLGLFTFAALARAR